MIIKGLAILLVALAVVGIGIATSGCAGTQVSARTSELVVAPVSPIITPRADYRSIQRYFLGDRSTGDLYVGNVIKVELHPVVSAGLWKRPLQPVSLTFANGVSVLGGYLEAGQHIEPGCQAILFTDKEIGQAVSSGAFSAKKPIMGLVLDKVRTLPCS